MTREEATEHACRTVAIAYHALGDYARPSDGFCESCSRRRERHRLGYENAGAALEFVRRAVVEKLEREHPAGLKEARKWIDF